MTCFGGVFGPMLSCEGISRAQAHHVAVLQHLEFALTVIAAVLVLRERPGWRGNVGIALVGLGVALFSLESATPEGTAPASWAGAALISG